MRARVKLILLLLITALISQAADGQSPPAPGGYHYSYFKEARPLTLDTSRLAVCEGLSRAADAPPLFELAAVPPGAVTAHIISPWSTIALSTDDQSAAGIRQTTERLAAQSGLEFVSPVFLDERGDPLIVTRDLLVGFQHGVSPDEALVILAQNGAGTVLDLDWDGLTDVYRVRSASHSGLDVLASANALATRPEVRYAQPDFIATCHQALVPNDPLFSDLWGLNNTGQLGGALDVDMDAPEAWDVTTGSPSVVVVILDDGIQPGHPDIHQIAGADFTGLGTGGGPGNECDNHGTAVAGCVAATINNNLGIVGIAPDCVVASAKWLITNVPCDGTGYFQVSWLANVLSWAQSLGARVTNTSYAFAEFSAITDLITKPVRQVSSTSRPPATSMRHPSTIPPASQR